MKTLLTVLLVVVIVAVCLFLVTFAVYFFNLDMKLLAKIEPFFTRHYDKIDRDQHL